MQTTLTEIGLFIVFLIVLAAPFLSKCVERNLEAFLFLMGIGAVTLAGAWHRELIEEAIKEPIVKGIVPAVLIAGWLFHYGRRASDRAMVWLTQRTPLPVMVFIFIVVLGLGSSVITAIIAALLLVELVNDLPIPRQAIVQVTIVACFSIGLGAALTPIGEPLSTIAIAKLQGEPYHAGFLFLFNLLGVYVIVGVLAMGIVGAWLTRRAVQEQHQIQTDVVERSSEIWTRTLRVYVFVAALILLGGGFQLLIDKYFTRLPAAALYWINMVSAILDNATLTAAEIAPSLHIDQIRSALMGLLISGGMLIPGNIPNIIAAHKLNITAKEWAQLGVPLGLVLMLAYFAWLFLLPV